MREFETWRKLISDDMAAFGDGWENGVQCTITDEQLDELFDSGYGGTEGVPFTLWTKTRVYFPVCYDGAEWVSSVPRDPNSESTDHVGG